MKSPAPWTWEHGDGVKRIRDANGEIVAVVLGGNELIDTLNAMAISATPELFELAVAFHSFLELFHGVGMHSLKEDPELFKFISQIKQIEKKVTAAISKVTGQ